MKPKCIKCKDKGHMTIMVWTGAYMFKPCDCEVAKEKARVAEEKLKKMYDQVMEKLNKQLVKA